MPKHWKPPKNGQDDYLPFNNWLVYHLDVEFTYIYATGLKKTPTEEVLFEKSSNINFNLL